MKLIGLLMSGLKKFLSGYRNISQMYQERLHRAQLKMKATGLAIFVLLVVRIAIFSQNHTLDELRLTSITSRLPIPILYNVCKLHWAYPACPLQLKNSSYFQKISPFILLSTGIHSTWLSFRNVNLLPFIYGSLCTSHKFKLSLQKSD